MQIEEDSIQRVSMAKKKDNQSAADLAFSIICDKILEGELKPAQRLTLREMSQMTGVSIIPVIDALHKLENEGLVESRPYLGSSVISLTSETKRDRYALRLAIESQVARMLASGNLREDVKYQLIEQARVVDQQIQTNEMARATLEMNYSFHAKLAELTECPSLVDALRRDHLFLLLEWQKASHWQKDKNYHDKEAISHVWLLKEIFSGDPLRAENAVRRHIASAKSLPEQLIS